MDYVRRDMITVIGPDFKTFIGATRTGTPDIVIGNRWANLNISMTQGPVTTSDHLPVYIKIATKPIVIESRKRLRLKNADWEKFQNNLNNSTLLDTNNGINNEESKTKEQIDKELKNWFKHWRRQ